MQVALGVTGSIAAYKACEVIRGLDRAGVEVQVILTDHGARFITPLTLQTLSRRKVWMDPFDLSDAHTIRHIELTRDLNALVVAPATANILAKLASGVADDLLSTFYLAVTAPVVVAPAMNTRMWLHPITRRNVERLRDRGVTVVDPESGWLAEGESGWGRLADPALIVEAALRAARRSLQLHGKTILVTAGPTREPVDPVRFLSNRSSGRMGYALAEAAARRGARVILISGPVFLAPPYGVRRVFVETSREMESAIRDVWDEVDVLFMAAAVSDYVPEARAEKIKKTGERMDLRLDPGRDILAGLGRDKGKRVLVGFAAETGDLRRNARAKLKGKNLDWIVANDVSRPGIGMDSERNAVTLLDRSGDVTEIPEAAKPAVADAILDHIFGPDGDSA